MFVTLQENTRPNTVPADELTVLLTALGFGADAPDVELDLMIDRFDQWTNPQGPARTCPSCFRVPDMDAELERVA